LPPPGHWRPCRGGTGATKDSRATREELRARPGACHQRDRQKLSHRLDVQVLREDFLRLLLRTPLVSPQRPRDRSPGGGKTPRDRNPVTGPALRDQQRGSGENPEEGAKQCPAALERYQELRHCTAAVWS